MSTMRETQMKRAFALNTNSAVRRASGAGPKE